LEASFYGFIKSIAFEPASWSFTNVEGSSERDDGEAETGNPAAGMKFKGKLQM
jgi:hypothetical protein